MEGYYKRKTPSAPVSIRNDGPSASNSTETRTEVDLASLPIDPGTRLSIMSYNCNDRDRIRRYYLQIGPCQPRDHDFPLTKDGPQNRRFRASWFDLYPDWLEYSVSKNVAYCLYCYLCGSNSNTNQDAFTRGGFNLWKRPEKLKIHIGESSSFHGRARGNCLALMDQTQHIATVFDKQTDQARIDYRTRLHSSVECIRTCLEQALSFCGHDESEESSNPGNFLALLKLLARNNNDIKVVTFHNAPGNMKMISPLIQKDIANAAAQEVLKVIISDLGDAPFSVLVDEARDKACKEQMAVVIRYVNIKGNVIERILGIEHVTDTCALTLKRAVDDLFCRNGLSISCLRGQGYDGASNMRGEYKGLKALILEENSSAFYVHCFAHQLQLCLVAATKKHKKIVWLFEVIGELITCVGVSCKRTEMLREVQKRKKAEAIEIQQLISGQGLNQESGLRRAGDTRWGSHYNSLVILTDPIMFDAVIDVLVIIETEADNGETSKEANSLLRELLSFKFVFVLHLMKCLLGITEALSQSLQKKDQEISAALDLVEVAKKRILEMRENGWTTFLANVESFSEKNHIDTVDMNSRYMDVVRGRIQRVLNKTEVISNLHYYQVDIFYTIIDLLYQELDARFTEGGTELLRCLACLNPSNSFARFDKNRLLRLAEFYPKDFGSFELRLLNDQLESYIADMRLTAGFSNLTSISDLAIKLVESSRDKVYPLVYSLVVLALTLPVATASVERAFSSMNIIKTRLRNRIGDEWLNDALIVYIEKDIFENISNDVIMQTFQSMRTRRGQLP